MRLNESHGLDAGNVETLPAPHVFAVRFVVHQDHVAEELGEARAIALIGALRGSWSIFLRTIQRSS
jgi:hypothetical protein